MENRIVTPQVRHIWRPVRSSSADTHLLGLIATYGATVMIVRTYLELTGYPQVGDSTYHIAHLLWGGLFMFSAIVMMLVWDNPWLPGLVMVLGGIGAGLFIDEVGKFITQKNDYFFPLAFPIIYSVTLVGVWLFFRLRRSGPRDARTLLYHATNYLKKVLDNDLDPIEYEAFVETLQEAIERADDPEEKNLAQHLLDFVQARDFRIEANPNWQERMSMRVRTWFAQHPPRRVLKSLLIAGMLWVAFLAALKLYALVSVALSVDFDIRTVLTNYVIINGKSRYVVNQPVLLSLQSLLVTVVGLLSLIAAGFVAIGREQRGVRLGVLGLVLALTAVNLITFYFNQLYTMFDALVQLAVLGLAQWYRWRFLTNKRVIKLDAPPGPVQVPAGEGTGGP